MFFLNNHLNEVELDLVAHAFSYNTTPNLSAKSLNHLEDCWMCRLKAGAAYDVLKSQKRKKSKNSANAKKKELAFFVA